MDDITINMSSSAGEDTQILNIVATNVQNTTFRTRTLNPTAADYNVSANSDIDNRSEQFSLGPAIFSFDTITGIAWAYVDEAQLVFNYPEGVYFDNRIDLDLIGEQVTGDYEGEHATVVVSEGQNGGGTITITAKNFRHKHAGTGADEDKMIPYFRADTNIFDTNNNVITMKVDWSIKRNGVTKTGDTTFRRTLVFSGGGRVMEIAPRNLTLRNLDESYNDIGFNQLLGGFTFYSELAYRNVTFKYEFTDKMGVREVTIPGKNIRNVVAKTTQGRTITVANIPGDGSLLTGVLLSDQVLELNNNEFILELTVTGDLPAQGNYNHSYWYSPCLYYGHFLNNETDDAKLSIIDENGEIEINVDTNEPMTGTDRSNIGWVKSGMGDMSVETTNSNGEAATVFYPNETISFNGSVRAGKNINKNITEIIDPTVIISLPAGVNLDISSVKASSKNGKRNGEEFSLSQSAPMTTQTIDGVEWKTYYFKSGDPLDLVSYAEQPINSELTRERIFVSFDATVSNSVSEYNLSFENILMLDLGMTAERTIDTDYTVMDTNNRAGKGNNYMLGAGHGSIQIKPLIGLNIDVGIRNKGYNQDFMTYDGTTASVASLSNSLSAEVKVYYESTDTSPYKANSTIYMPIPKKGMDYEKFFENKEIRNPMQAEENAVFGYSFNLASIPVMDSSDGTTWTTFFATNVSGSNSEAYTVDDGNWEPVESTGNIDWVAASDYTGDLANVKMIKFVANSDIAPGSKGSCIYDIVIDGSTSRALRAVNYWRTYNKAVTKDNNSGIWNYSSIIAADVDGVVLNGQFFIDHNLSASFENGDEKYTGGLYGIYLSRDDNSEPMRELIIDESGYFTSRAKAIGAGIDFLLREGDYTLTITRNDAENRYVFSEVESDESSNSSAFYNDIKNIDIDENKIIAKRHFTVNLDLVSNDGYSFYVGIGLADSEESEPEPTPEPEPPVPVPNTGAETMSKNNDSAYISCTFTGVAISFIITGYRAITKRNRR